MDNLASQWATVSQWLFPVTWVVLGGASFVRRHRVAGVSLLVAGLSALLFAYLFSPESSFTASWETDAPLNIAFDYKPIGFLAANLLPAITNFSIVVACVSFIRRRG
ncbi:hypothetical protein [Paucibacter sp. B51]|uniref:hypothetical protein n=1 Tax=Paucibacter sp. B51 TaxID=2993315 RepID=UPI0022EBD9F5|nr:hypothetical protein [Paucibacter sp. B51]